MSTLEKAISLATEAHNGQKDKSGEPYILHPLRVMARVQSNTEKIVAVLHDIIEDTDYTIENLREKGYSKEVLEAIDCLTKRDGKDYDEYLKRSNSNPIAQKVKIADLEDNMDIRRLNVLKEEDLKRLNKYLRAWKYLTKEGN
jgi:(p)ppGpp synthase/HD superfamily hydrolase